MPPDAAIIDPPVIPAAPVAPSPTDWRTYMTDDLKADPVVSDWSGKAGEKDIASLIKTHAHAQKRLGTAINLPGKDAKPEEVQALKAKLYEAGVLTAPPADPKDYGIVKPEQLPEGLQWSDELSGKFATALHKHGVPKAALADLMPLYMEAITGNVKTLQIDEAKSVALTRAEHGEKYDERAEMVDRMLPAILDPASLQFLKDTNLVKDSRLNSFLLRMAPFAMQDSSFLESIPRQGGEMTAEAAKEEHAKVMNDKTHPMYAGFHRVPMDPKAEAYVTEIYRKAYGTKKEE